MQAQIHQYHPPIVIVEFVSHKLSYSFKTIKLVVSKVSMSQSHTKKVNTAFSCIDIELQRLYMKIDFCYYLCTNSTITL